MSSNQFLIDAASRHSLFVQRFSAGVEKNFSASLAEILGQLAGLIASEEISSLSVGRLGSLRLQLASDGFDAFNELSDEIIEEVLIFARSEAGFHTELLDRATKDSANVTAPPDTSVDYSVLTNPMDVAPGHQVSIRRALDEFGAAKISQVDQILRDGFTDGSTSQEVVKKLRAILPLQQRQLSSLVRTSNNAASTLAAYQTMIENRDILEGYEWVSTLDSRTSNICKARDGKIFPFDINSPRPPAHWGCRSTIIPKVKAKFDLGSELDGERPSVGDSGAQVVGGNVTYGGWLRTQPKEFVVEALGRKRAELFIAGDFKIEGFVDPTGRTYTLDELQNLNPMAFQ